MAVTFDVIQRIVQVRSPETIDTLAARKLAEQHVGRGWIVSGIYPVYSRHVDVYFMPTAMYRRRK